MCIFKLALASLQDASRAHPQLSAASFSALNNNNVFVATDEKKNNQATFINNNNNNYNRRYISVEFSMKIVNQRN